MGKTMDIDTVIPFVKLLAALCIGMLIGWEREHRENIPGMQLLPLVAVGATLFTVSSGVTETGTLLNPQIAGGIVTGVGFLGAGMISRQFGTLTGVTTAALGVSLGLGYYMQVIIVTAAVLAILWFFPKFSRSSNHSLYYEIKSPYDEEHKEALNRQFEKCNLKILRYALSRHGDQMVCGSYANGGNEEHNRIGRELIRDPRIVDFNTRLNG